MGRSAGCEDTIIVSDGIHLENIDFRGKAITFRSANGPTTTIIDGGDTSCVVMFARGEPRTAVLTGFTIQHGRTSERCGFEGAGIHVANASPTITGNVITDNHGCPGAGISVGFGSPLIQNNLITQNQSPCSGGWGGGISIRGRSSAQIIGNTITSNDAGNGSGGGIALFAAGTTIIRGNLISGNTGSEGGGISMVNDSMPDISDNVIIQNAAFKGGGIAALIPSDSPGPRIVNNTIARNTASSEGSELYLDGFARQTQIWNNILFGTSTSVAVSCDPSFDSTPPVFGFNVGFNTAGPVYTTSCADVTGTNGNISVDPRFVSSSDFHLDPTSPVIDAGSNMAPGLPDNDFAGSPRVVDGNADGTATVDMGAFELTPGLLDVAISRRLAPAGTH